MYACVCARVCVRVCDYGAPFVTSRILLTEYNSVGQNTILSNRIQFCLTELHSVDRM